MTIGALRVESFTRNELGVLDFLCGRDSDCREQAGGIVMYRVYRMYRGVRIEVGTYESEKRARKMIALKARYNKYCFIEKVSE